MTNTVGMMRQVWFTEALRVEVREAALPTPAPDQLRVRTHCSAISAGTEMLVYRGQLPQDMALDTGISALQHSPQYPLQYGYACVGVVEAIGEAVDVSWLGRRVFAFAPHASHFLMSPQDVFLLPDDLAFEDAVFLANMETAVNLVQDGHPVIGERVLVLGLGIVGLLLSALLARFPLTQLRAVEHIEKRRAMASLLGLTELASPEQAALQNTEADLVFELTGVPDALNLAIEATGYGSRIVVGSWYGSKSAPIALGGKAHRNRLNITTSQVSSIAPQLSARWDKQRRFALCWQMLNLVQPQRLITHRVDIAEAANIYASLHEAPADIVQAVFIYD